MVGGRYETGHDVALGRSGCGQPGSGAGEAAVGRFRGARKTEKSHWAARLHQRQPLSLN